MSVNAQPGPFISYARKDQAFVRKLDEALRLHQRDPWVDWEILPADDWMREIRSEIDAAPAFVCVLSPDAIASHVWREELGHALAQHKRIIPLVCRTVDPQLVPEDVRRLNWIFALDPAALDNSVGTLISAMDVDLDWVRVHSRLLIRAQEWETKGRDRSLLLRGADLKESEEWLARITDEQAPRRTPLQSQYVLASRRAQTLRHRYTTGAISGALIVTSGLAIVALIQSRIATSQRNIALSRMLAAQALRIAEDPLGRLDAALLQSVAAYQLLPTVEAQASLFRVLMLTNRVEKFVHASGTLVALDISSDGRTIASGDSQGRIILWDAQSLQAKSTLQQGRDFVQSLAFRPDGITLAAADAGRVVLWNPANETRGREFESHNGRITHVAWDASGSVLIVNADAIVFWDTVSGQPLGVIDSPGDADRRRVAVSPDRKTVASAGVRSRDITLWDAVAHKQRMVLHGAQPGVTALVFSSDGGLLASGGADGSLDLWETSTGVKRWTLKKHTDAIDSVTFSRDGKRLASGSRDSVIVISDVETQRTVQALFAYSNGVLDLAFAPNNTVLLSHGFDDRFVVWNLGAPEFATAFTGHEHGVRTVAVSPDGTTLASGADDGTVRLWDIPAGAERATLKGHEAQLVGVAFTRDGRLIASAAAEHNVLLWDARTGIRLGQIDAGGNVVGIAFSPDGKLVASAVELSRAVSLWDPATRQLETHLAPGEDDDNDDDVASLAFSHDGKVLVAAGASTIRTWDVVARKQLRPPMHADSTISRIALAPDGRTLAVSETLPTTVLLWDVASGTHPAVLNQEDNAGGAEIAFSPNGKMLAFTSGDARLKVTLWDVTKRKAAATLDLDSTAMSLAFTADGKRLVTGHSNGAITLWDVDVESWPQRACAIANRDFTSAEWRVLVGDTVPPVSVCTKNR